MTPVQLGPVGHYAAEYKIDAAQFVLGPYEYVEYKYRLEKGASMLYSWTASSPVAHDLYGARDGGPRGEVRWQRFLEDPDEWIKSVSWEPSWPALPAVNGGRGLRMDQARAFHAFAG